MARILDFLDYSNRRIFQILNAFVCLFGSDKVNVMNMRRCDAAWRQCNLHCHISRKPMWIKLYISTMGSCCCAATVFHAEGQLKWTPSINPSGYSHFWELIGNEWSDLKLYAWSKILGKTRTYLFWTINQNFQTRTTFVNKTKHTK